VSQTKSSKTHKGKQCLNRLKKGGKALGGNGNLRPVRDGNERSRGRKAGVPNKTTRILKEAILQAAEELGELERRTVMNIIQELDDANCLAGIFAAAHGMRGVHSSPHCLQCR
jgi:hypothetical protein